MSLESTRTIGLSAELGRPANLLSLLRIPLGVAAFVLRAHPWALLGLMVAAGVSDVLDGAVARRGGGDHSVGAWLDPLCDKLFVLGAVAGVWLVRRPPLWILGAILARELVVVIPVLIHLVSPGRGARPLQYRARPIGKATTVAQFAVLVAVVLDRIQLASAFAAIAGVLGVAAGVDYAWRARGVLRASEPVTRTLRREPHSVP